jgi:hypothetical protein
MYSVHLFIDLKCLNLKLCTSDFVFGNTKYIILYKDAKTTTAFIINNIPKYNLS